jgi:hypothetical protein
MNRGLLSLLCLGLLADCRGRTPSPPLSVESVPARRGTRLVLHPSSGLKLNARLPPALELAGGKVVRFHADRLTSDSAYFAEPPSALIAGLHQRVHGTLRASVCDSGATVCRAIEIKL